MYRRHFIAFLQIYDNGAVSASQYRDFLNQAVPSNHIYGGDDPDNGKIYGDGRSQWNHLNVKAEGDYATLPALAMQALAQQGKFRT